MVRTFLLVAVLGAITALSGYVHGVYSGRWVDSAELEAAVPRLERVPLVIGDWRAEVDELNPRDAKLAGFRGYLARRYENRRTGAKVAVLLACGRAGPLSVHTPEQCYRASGYHQQGAAEPYAPTAGTEAPRGAFWTAQLVKDAVAAPTRLRIYWAWNTGGGWEAPNSPRFAFAGTPALYKLYVQHEMGRANEGAAEGPSSEFLRELLPVLQKALSPKS